MNGGELQQIQFLLGHASVLTTERYPGCNRTWRSPSTTALAAYSLRSGFAIRPDSNN
ncbi:hypothetical protein [Tunturiibacter psychrotolerans]|uniref:hypothetical protein n=1 Tax=Tunturiibacter psychrotolerans TaxID=3069686 RepID=UPI003D1C8F33